MPILSDHLFITVTDPQYGGGAVGDDATDNATALLAAVTEAKASGKGLYFPRGIYQTSATLDFTGLTVVGDRDKSVIKLAASQDKDLIQILADNTYLFHLGFDGNSANQTIATHLANNRAVIRCDSAITTIIDSCHVDRGAAHGIVFTNGCHRQNVVGCHVGFCEGWCIDMDSADGMISDCHIFFGGGGGTTYGNLRVEDGPNIVTHCHIWQATGPNVLITTSKSGAVISGCRIDGGSRENIRVEDGQLVQIYDNLLYDAGVVHPSISDPHGNADLRCDVKMTGNSSQCIVEGNTCGARAKTWGAESYTEDQQFGIIDDGAGNSIIGNLVVNAAQNGIKVTGKAATVTGNRIMGTAGYAIQVAGANHRICDNDVSLCANGINVDGDDCILDRNMVVEQTANASTTLSANVSNTVTLPVASEAGFSPGDLIQIMGDNGVPQIRRVDTVSAGQLTVDRSLFGAGTVASLGNTVSTRLVATGINLTAGSSGNVGAGNRVLRQSGSAFADAGSNPGMQTS